MPTWRSTVRTRVWLCRCELPLLCAGFNQRKLQLLELLFHRQPGCLLRARGDRGIFAAVVPSLDDRFYVGPQIVNGSNFAVSGTSVEIAAGANASYASRTTAYSATYSRGVNNGSGVIAGSLLRRHLGCGNIGGLGASGPLQAMFAFSRSTSLPDFQLYAFESKGVTLSAQIARNLGRVLLGLRQLQHSEPVSS